MIESLLHDSIDMLLQVHNLVAGSHEHPCTVSQHQLTMTQCHILVHEFPNLYFDLLHTMLAVPYPVSFPPKPKYETERTHAPDCTIQVPSDKHQVTLSWV